MRIASGDTLLELGPGHGFLAVKAALAGVHVVAVEHPESHYVPYLKANLKRFDKAIFDAHGSVHVIYDDIRNSELAGQLRRKSPKEGFTHIFAIDVLRPGDPPETAQIETHESLWGVGTGRPKMGIDDTVEVEAVLRILLSMKRHDEGTFYTNHIMSLETAIGGKDPQRSFRATGTSRLLANMGVPGVKRLQLSTPRNPNPAAELFVFGRRSLFHRLFHSKRRSRTTKKSFARTLTIIREVDEHLAEKANVLLWDAKAFLAGNLTAKAKSKLARIVRNWPGSDQAIEARDLLDNI